MGIDLEGLVKAIGEQHDKWSGQLARLLVGRDCVLTGCGGRYRGRRAKIAAVMIDYDGRVRVLAHPYKVVHGVRGEELLWDHRDARSYWPVDKVDLIEESDDV